MRIVMTGTLDMGREELRSRLLAFDRAVGLLFPERSFRLVIVGGGALVLLGCLARATSDIDVLDVPSELHSLLEQYDLSGQVNAYLDNFAYNMEDRLVPLGLPTNAVTCYTASLEDIVASKLHSARPTDVADVRRPEVLAAVDWARLAEIVVDMKASRLNDRRYQAFLDNYHEYKQEFGPCER
jgi:hypothetical protein